MKLIAEYMQIDADRNRRQLFTVHFPVDESSALDWVYSRPGLSDLESDDSLVLNSRYLPPSPYMVLAGMDYQGRYRYFYLYVD